MAATMKPVKDTPPLSSQLFSCPEEGCTMSYQRFSSLQHHMDCGKHERSLERETLLDKAVHGYAERLEEQFSSMPQIQPLTTSRGTMTQPLLPMGWALKASHTTRKRFSEKQKEYLTNKFVIGETTGQKANAADVARSMMKAKDINGDRLFNNTQFLTAKQIANFFSRMASKRTLQSAHVVEDADFDDEDSIVTEQALSELRSDVINALVPVHPICYDFHNLCELMAKSKLPTFAIVILQEMCEHFQIPTSDIKSRRKAPYVERLQEFLKNCSCCNA